MDRVGHGYRNYYRTLPAFLTRSRFSKAWQPKTSITAPPSVSSTPAPRASAVPVWAHGLHTVSVVNQLICLDLLFCNQALAVLVEVLLCGPADSCPAPIKAFRSVPVATRFSISRVPKVYRKRRSGKPFKPSVT